MEESTARVPVPGSSRPRVVIIPPDAPMVKEWRIRVQKVFLPRPGVVNLEALPEMDVLFTTIEAYDGMNHDTLMYSKIGRVLRLIHALPLESLPHDDDFHFRERALALIEKWVAGQGEMLASVHHVPVPAEATLQVAPADSEPVTPATSEPELALQGAMASLVLSD
ncbi:hypothetical protein EVG20_g6406 [Dentipellis fragilis]|uniref:TFIIS N-terminal domain-containing protein n=1 Tax=Dentipellis fragilis TaxID=205917 RepID=A0A4Y9YNE4_9AGAM|nr:hypothetical protein EVG20_g6406 [Dentipellis fragilis]